MQYVKLNSMIKNFEKREVVVLNLFNLMLKTYGKLFLKICGNPVHKHLFQRKKEPKGPTHF